MSLKSIITIIIIVIFLISHIFVILRTYFLVKKIEKDNEKLKKSLKLIEQEDKDKK